MPIGHFRAIPWHSMERAKMPIGHFRGIPWHSMERAKMPIGYFRAIHVVICLPGLTVTGDPFGVTCHRRRFEMTKTTSG